jgi:hypothetical protein
MDSGLAAIAAPRNDEEKVSPSPCRPSAPFSRRLLPTPCAFRARGRAARSDRGCRCGRTAPCRRCSRTIPASAVESPRGLTGNAELQVLLLPHPAPAIGAGEREASCLAGVGAAAMPQRAVAVFRRSPAQANDRRRFASGRVPHAVWRARQKPTTRSAVEGISLAKFTRALSMSVGAGTRFGPSRNRISARTVAHSRPMVLPSIRIGS